MLPTGMNTWGSAWPMAPVTQHSRARCLPSTVLDTGYLQTGCASSILPKDLKCRQVFTWDLGKKKLKELVLGLPWTLVSRIKPCSLSSSPESLANGPQDTVLPLSAYFSGKICTVLGVRTLATKELDHPQPASQVFLCVAKVIRVRRDALGTLLTPAASAQKGVCTCGGEGESEKSELWYVMKLLSPSAGLESPGV